MEREWKGLTGEINELVGEGNLTFATSAVLSKLRINVNRR